MYLKHFTTFASAIAVAACSVGPDYAPPATPSSAAGPFIAAEAGAVQPLAPVPGDWWRLYDDPVLDGLISDALAANTDIRAAAARVAKARALLRETKVDRLPEVAARAAGTRGREPGESDVTTSFDASLAVAYELDLFGRVSRGVEAARGDVAAAEADAETVRVAIVAETARAYADAASASERLAVATHIVDLLDQSLRLTTRRVEIGANSRLDSARIAALRNQRQAEIPGIAAERDSALFRLAMLTGRAPADLAPAAGARKDALELAQPIPVGDGAQLLARRPDVRAAERRLAASTARIGVATADLYPRIALGGSVGSAAGSLGSLFSNPVGWLLGPLISWSFTDHARARARVAGAEADTQEARAEFDGTVLRSLQETATALSAYAHALRQREALRAAREEAEVAARILRARHREGEADSLALIDAERTYAEADAAVADMNGRISTSQIDLFRALGGGWTGAPAPAGQSGAKGLQR